jgi:hypothetical protein
MREIDRNLPSSLIFACAARNLIALRAARVMAALRSLSRPTTIQCLSVSARGHAKFFLLWRTTWICSSFMRVSIAERQISPSPCTAWLSPV